MSRLRREVHRRALRAGKLTEREYAALRGASPLALSEAMQLRLDAHNRDRIARGFPPLVAELHPTKGWRFSRLGRPA